MLSNYSALAEAVKVYTDAMRPLVEERLRAKYGGEWWERGVIRTLPEHQKEPLRRNVKQDTRRERVEHLDATHIGTIIERNFNDAFAGVFGDRERTGAWLAAIRAARNAGTAHSRSGDLATDETGNYLYSIVQVLRTAGLPEAEMVEEVRRQVLGMEPTEATPPPAAADRAPRPAAAPAPAGALPYWWQVCAPHDAFQNPAGIDEGLFAATLGMVHKGAGRDEYRDPGLFFAHTYFTTNLKLTIHDIVSRLGGGQGPSVIEMQTPFGGGKTHALLTLYHLIKNPERSLAVPGVREALGDLTFPPGTRVLAFDGQEWGTDPMPKETGHEVQTLWGELAYQADPSLYRRLIAASDERGEAPGNERFRQVLEAASPCLILIDELVSYLVKLKFASRREVTNRYRQTVQFVQELLQLAGNVTGVCVLISLPKSRAEFGGLDPAQLQQELGIVDELQPRAERVATKRTPVNDEEIYTLMSRRLFKQVDRAAAERAARAYREIYERNRELYDARVFTDDYLQQQVAAYPLHPELIDVLYKKWSTASDFPRTRTVLQLLAGVVADQWVNRREAYSIQPGHVNLERERIRTKVISAAGTVSGYDAVVAADIIGGDAHADMLDERRGGEYERFHIARGLATTLLMHSFGGRMRSGALPADLYLGVVAPNAGPEYATTIMEYLEQQLWYVHREGNLLRFQTRPNVYRVIAQTAETQPVAMVTERLQRELPAAAGEATGFRVPLWAGGDGAIAERPEPCIAVLDPRYAVAQADGSGPAGRERIEPLWERAGSGLRQWRNALILVAPDQELWSRTEEAMREVLAYESILASTEKGGRGGLEISDTERKELKERFAGKKGSLRTSLASAYRWVFYPDDQGLSALSLPPAIDKETIAGRVVTRLSDATQGPLKILPRMAAPYFNIKIAPRVWRDDANAPLDLADLNRRFLQWSYLPILPGGQETLRACVRDGLKQGLWAVAIGDYANMRYARLIEHPDGLDEVPNLFDGTASLVRGDLLRLIREQVAPTETPEETPPPETPEAGGPAATAAPAGTVTTPPVAPPVIPKPSRRRQVRLEISGLRIAKTANLQPYLFKPLQEQDPGAELTLTIEVHSPTGISDEVLEGRIVEGLDQLGITVRWEPS